MVWFCCSNQIKNKPFVAINMHARTWVIRGCQGNRMRLRRS